MPYFSPAPSLALAAVHRPPLRSKGLGDILACLDIFSTKSAHSRCPGFMPLLTPTGFSTPSRWEQDWVRIMRPRCGKGGLRERVLLVSQ